MPKKSVNKVEEYLDREAKCVDDLSESSDDSDDENASVVIKKKKSLKRIKKHKKNQSEGNIILF